MTHASAGAASQSLESPEPVRSLWQTIRDSGTRVALTVGETLPLDDGCLIEAGAVALFSDLEGRATCVGLTTVSEFVGLTRTICMQTSPLRAVVVCDGAALRYSRLALRREWETSAYFREAAVAEARNALEKARLWSACQQRHSARQRLATLLLALGAGRRGGVIRLSQETAARVLNVRRTTITAAAAELHDARATQWRRGGAMIVDPDALKESACSCARRYGPMPGCRADDARATLMNPVPAQPVGESEGRHERAIQISR